MADTATLNALSSWVTVHNPEHTGPAGFMTPTVRAARISLDQAFDSPLTPASMTVTGDRNRAANAQTSLFGTQMSTGPSSSESIDKMLKEPQTGLMHVSDMARIKAGWHPVTLEDGQANADAYNRFLNAITSFPLVTMRYAERQTVTRQSSNWDSLINAIADTFVGIQGEDKTQIVGGLKNLALAASSQMKETETTSLFCQGALNVANDAYDFYLYNSKVTFYHEKTKGFELKQNTFDVLKIKLSLVMPLWTRETVSMIIGQTTQSLADWINGNSTQVKPGTQPIPALFG